MGWGEVDFGGARKSQLKPCRPPTMKLQTDQTHSIELLLTNSQNNQWQFVNGLT